MVQNNENVKKAFELNYKYHKNVINSSHTYKIKKVSNIQFN
jgi:hypothetical protein